MASYKTKTAALAALKMSEEAAAIEGLFVVGADGLGPFPWRIEVRDIEDGAVLGYL